MPVDGAKYQSLVYYGQSTADQHQAWAQGYLLGLRRGQHGRDFNDEDWLHLMWEMVRGEDRQRVERGRGFRCGLIDAAGLFSCAEAARLLGVDRTTTYRQARAGKLASIRIGDAYAIEAAALIKRDEQPLDAWRRHGRPAP